MFYEGTINGTKNQNKKTFKNGLPETVYWEI